MTPPRVKDENPACFSLDRVKREPEPAPGPSGDTPFQGLTEELSSTGVVRNAKGEVLFDPVVITHPFAASWESRRKRRAGKK